MEKNHRYLGAKHMSECALKMIKKPIETFLPLEHIYKIQNIYHGLIYGRQCLLDTEI